MKRELDPVDSALRSLGGQHWPGPECDPKLEDKLMSSFDSPTPSTPRRFARIRQHPVIAASIAILLVGSVSFAATNGGEVVQEIKEIVGKWICVIHVGEVDLDKAVYDPETDSYTLTLEASQTDGEAPVVWMTDELGEPIEGEFNCAFYQDMSEEELQQLLESSEQFGDLAGADGELTTTQVHEITVMVKDAEPGKEVELVVEVDENGEAIVEKIKAGEKQEAEKPTEPQKK